MDRLIKQVIINWPERGATPGFPSISSAREDKKYLAETYASSLGVVTGYCIRFKTLKDINTDVLEAACAFGLENTNKKAS